MVTHPVRRALASAVVTLALVAVLLLVPDAVRVYATNLMGPLRAPGEPAFVAGHRGDRASAPENTMPAFASAFASGLEFVETDVQLTADGHPVLIHDETVDRTTDGTGAVADLTLEQIRALDAGSWYAPEFAGTQVPVLDEFLDALAGSKKKALVELKGFWTADEIRGILGDIYARGVQNRVVFASFDLSTVANAVDAAPAIPRVIIKRDLPSDPVGLAQYYDAIAILTTPNSLESDPEAVTRMHEAGLGVLVYTLNSAKRWSEALEYGVDGIITDKPSKLDGWIAETAPGT
ncbi:glycerophosphodiester phosphodiesterase [Protaetiibacter intestinalis]|nr:glycerophosphodiester phosphodiesterase family protein [Protaetiibacter intestinalis]